MLDHRGFKDEQKYLKAFLYNLSLKRVRHERRGPGVVDLKGKDLSYWQGFVWYAIDLGILSLTNHDGKMLWM